MRLLPLVLALSALSAFPSGAAAEPRKLEYLVEVGNGIGIPIGGDSYNRVADPSYVASLRFALGIPIVGGLRLGPALELDGSPVNSDDATFENNFLDARFARVRFYVGPDVRYRVIPRLDLWFHFLVGLDHADGNVTSKLLVNVSQGYSSTVFGFVPAIGATVGVWRMLVVGLGIAFPFAVNHRFGNATPFNAADAELSLLLGARF
jgi:hypothetical protein